MQLIEALKLVSNGKKIRRKIWGKDCFIKLVRSTAGYEFVDQERCNTSVNGKDLAADDWEEYVHLPLLRKQVTAWFSKHPGMRGIDGPFQGRKESAEELYFTMEIEIPKTYPWNFEP